MGVKVLHIERKLITSVVHSHPPSPYIRKHAPGRLLVNVHYPPYAKQNIMPCILHCALAVDNFITFLSYEIERLSFLARPCRVSAFGALHHLQASNKHSVVCHLWRRVTRVLKNCMSHNLTSPFVTRGARVLRGIENQILGRPFCAKPVFVRIYGSALGTAA